ncbi:sugar ABC transporter permease [Oceanirhabdus sp. W0125-5]|uniref:sugar ABC transporter permease n=1 Tax=Oceanirhabdus sp. W0125-5 TaxID=2999116 RepID=UPI0022F2BF66|nr:sugar ABC transporter permease [Oceanirhabdus sp. W0125-5]WBW98232.1 sugar ABC transporter permease [Oceanirhabdus sp. W0125-5]
MTQNDKLNNKSVLDIIKFQLKNNIRQYTMFIALIGIMVIFSLLNGNFFTPRNLSTLMLQTAHIAILACGVVLVIVAGHIDLSIGAVVGLTGAACAILMRKFGGGLGGIVLAVVITLAIGAIIGLWQGYWVAYRKVPAFIVTLAGMMFFNGLLLKITNGETIPVPNAFKVIGQDYIPTIFGGSNSVKDMIPHNTTIVMLIAIIVIYVVMELKKRKERQTYEFEVLPSTLFVLKLLVVISMISFVFIILSLYRGVPYSTLLLMVVGGLYTFITTKTTFGRHVYAIGGNKEAAKLSGIDIKKRTLWIFISSGILGAIGGMLYTARLASATAAAGQGMELEVIAAAIIGGTSTLGGEGTIMGAIVGALVMATLNNGMLLMDVGTPERLIVKGFVLLLAVWIDISTRKKNA